MYCVQYIYLVNIKIKVYLSLKKWRLMIVCARALSFLHFYFSFNIYIITESVKR